MNSGAKYVKIIFKAKIYLVKKNEIFLDEERKLPSFLIGFL